MLTKSWFENLKFRLKLALSVSIISSFLASVYLANRFNETEGQGWYFPYLKSQALSQFRLGNGVSITGETHSDFIVSFCRRNPHACTIFDEKTHSYFIRYPLMIFTGVFSGLFVFLVYFGNRKKDDEEHRRGAQLASPRQLRKLLKNIPASITFGGVPFPFEFENRHLLLVGAPGVGKSVALQTILAAIRDRGDRALIVDPGGAHLAKFARPGDALLNPLDRRSKAWSPFAEGLRPWEREAMARSLVPPAEGSSGTWADLAKTVMAGLLEQCQAKGIPTNHYLAGLAGCGDAELLAKVLAGHPAHGLVASGSPQTVGSILTNLGERAAGLRHLPPDAGVDGFSISDWVRNGKGWLFLSPQISQREALKTVLAAQLDVAARAVLDLPPNERRRVWLIVDELPLLGKVSSIVEFLTNARKNGGAAVLGIQSLSQLREVYGRETATTLLSCMSSQLIFRMPDPETSDYLSKMIGEREITRRTESQGRTEQGRSKTISETITNTRVVMPAEIQKLPNLAGFLCLPACPVGRVELAIPQLDDLQKPFVAAELPPRRPLVIPADLPSETSVAPAPAKPEKKTVPAAEPEPPTVPDGLEIDEADIPESAFEDAEVAPENVDWRTA